MAAVLLQPPSGGCVLKHSEIRPIASRAGAAAFGRLCVETMGLIWNLKKH